MKVDVSSEIVIRRPREAVAGYAADPDNAPTWYVNIERVEWRTPPPLRVGSELAFIAAFLGRRLAYTYRVVDFLPGERLVMSTSEGPFPMETTYSWEDVPDGGTRMMLRNRGKPTGFSRLLTPFLVAAIRRENRRDLRRLKELLETPSVG